MWGVVVNFSTRDLEVPGSSLGGSTFLAVISLGKEFTHIAHTNSAFHPSVVDKLSTSFGWGYGGNDRLCRVAVNNVRSH
jgi:hypothetical protein